KECYMDTGQENREVSLLMQNADNRLDFVNMTMHTSLHNLEQHYNDDLISVNEVLLNRLNKENDKGLVILYGKSGTGKTTYIRSRTFTQRSLDRELLFQGACFGENTRTLQESWL